MNRFALSTVASLLVVGVLFAEDKGADATKDKLQTAKAEFRTAIAKAKDKLDAGFDAEEKVLLENARLKADERIKRVEQLKEEKSLFVRTARCRSRPKCACSSPSIGTPQRPSKPPARSRSMQQPTNT